MGDGDQSSDLTDAGMGCKPEPGNLEMMETILHFVGDTDVLEFIKSKGCSLLFQKYIPKSLTKTQLLPARIKEKGLDLPSHLKQLFKK